MITTLIIFAEAIGHVFSIYYSISYYSIGRNQSLLFNLPRKRRSWQYFVLVHSYSASYPKYFDNQNYIM